MANGAMTGIRCLSGERVRLESSASDNVLAGTYQGGDDDCREGQSGHPQWGL